jgi:hypothetical protein
MMQNPTIPQVGAQDPQLKNSPIAEEEGEDTEVVRQQVPGEPVCFFNGKAYENGDYVASGPELLRCSYGIWIDAGGSDPGNP